MLSQSQRNAPHAEFEHNVGRVSIAKCGAAGLRRVNRGLTGSGRGPELFDIIIPCSCPISFCQNDRSGEALKGEYILLKRDCFYEISSEKSLLHWRITIPASDIRNRISAIDDHLGKRFDQNSRMAELLHGLVNMIVRTFSEESPPNPEALATEIISFIALVLSSEIRQESAVGRNTRYRLKQRVFDFVERNLNDADLSPRKIAKENGISLSYLYKLFSDNNTTVGQFIQAKRLQRAYELLVADPKRAVTVSEIAYLVGFKNASHFSRAFSQHFRTAPRDARQSGLSVQARQGSKKALAPPQKTNEPAHLVA